LFREEGEHGHCVCSREVTGLFYESVIMELVAVPEFLAGLHLARYYRRRAQFKRGTLLDVIFGGGLFIASALCGTTFRYFLFGTPSPGFISFGYGIAFLTERDPA
jgi:hypothetical protein